MSRSKDFGSSSFMEGEFDYSLIRNNLPELVAKSEKIFKITGEGSSCFYACSEKVLRLFIEDVVKNNDRSLSFFDDMDSFKTEEKIGLEALGKLEPRASEYSINELNFLKSKLKP